MERLDLTRLEDGMRPYLRDATIAIVPGISDAQLERIRDELRRLNPFVLVRRLTGSAIQAEGIPVYAAGTHDADVFAWSLIQARVARALTGSRAGAAHVTSIDVRDPAVVLR